MFSPNEMFSRTVIDGYSAYDWNTIAMSRSFGDRSLTTLPSMQISPLVTVSSPAIMLSSVDFPQPEPPTRIRNCPSSISMSTPFRTGTPFG